MALRNDSQDPYQALRIDTDHMSYEELLQLCDRIGYVKCGLKDKHLRRCLRNIKPSEFPATAGTICSICLCGYKTRAGIKVLNCGHIFHFDCLRNWLYLKNQCPVCKSAPRTALDEEARNQI